MKSFFNLIAKIALFSAKTAAGEASVWYQYQPKEPLALKELLQQ